MENYTESGMDNRLTQIREEVCKTIIGQGEVVDLLLTAILAEGHVLLEGVPGVAKTMTAKMVAKLIDSAFSRIQFTSDILPSDILGTNVFNNQKGGFDFHKGPVFADIVLVDEINRAPAKTQSALFEVMEERQATIDGTTYQMPEIYTIVATQNPIDQEGTYRLPEAQMDRFIFRINVGYPDAAAEMAILQEHNSDRHVSKLEGVKPILSKEDIISLREKASSIFVDEKVMSYIVALVQSTRNHGSVLVGASPRASIALLNASKAYALLQGREFVIPDDVKRLATAVLAHRMSLTAEAEMEGRTLADVIAEILAKTEVVK